MLGKNGYQIRFQQEKSYQSDEFFFSEFEKVSKMQARDILNKIPTNHLTQKSLLVEAPLTSSRNYHGGVRPPTIHREIQIQSYLKKIPGASKIKSIPKS